MLATSLENGNEFHSAQRVITFMFVWWRPFEKEFNSIKGTVKQAYSTVVFCFTLGQWHIIVPLCQPS